LKVLINGSGKKGRRSDSADKAKIAGVEKKQIEIN